MERHDHTSKLLSETLQILDAEILRLKATAALGPLSPIEARTLGTYAKTLVAIDQNDRDAQVHAADGADELSDDELIAFARNAVASLDASKKPKAVDDEG